MTALATTVERISDPEERKRVVGHVLRYELYRHRDITERLSDLLDVHKDPEQFNRSTWDILYFLMQCYLQGTTPNVTDIYLATGISKGTAITGLAELERRGAISKARDGSDGRRRRIDISEDVAAALESFVAECGDKLGHPFEVSYENGGALRNNGGATETEPLISLLNQLSHELRTPLTAIVGFSEMIANETLGPVHPVGYAEYARDIRRAASHLLDSLNELVDTTLAERGVSIPLGVLTNVDLEDEVDQACRANAGLAERRGIVLRRKWSASKGRIVGDKERLMQAIRKLIAAIVASSGKNQAVDVETTFDAKTGMTIRLISPEPPGVPTKILPKKTIGTPTQPTVHMVLPLVRAIVEAHGGKIELKQEGARRFVTTLRLPKDGPVHG